MKDQNDIDQLFKDGLTDPEILFNELDWNKMERKLDAKDKKRIIPIWIFTASGIAAVLTVILLWFFTKPSNVNQNIKIESIVIQSRTQLKQKIGANDKNSLAKQQQKNSPKQDLSVALVTAKKVQIQFKQSNSENKIYTIIDIVPLRTVLKEGKIVLNDPLVIMQHLGLPVQTDSDAILIYKANELAQSKEPSRKSISKPGQKNHDELTRSIQKKMDAASGQSHALILSAMAAPDISTAKYSKSSKVSTNVGMLATYALGSRFSLTSGAIYAKKYYNSTGTSTQNNLYSSTSNNWEVDADCNVLDIPLNVNYKLLNNKKLSVSINTGLSSYIMLKEKYDFITDQPDGTKKLSSLELNNQNQHLFGIANVSLSFEHQITKTVSVGLQPFAKLPLTGIGYGDASLKSAGVSFSINIGLFPTKKPGKYASLR